MLEVMRGRLWRELRNWSFLTVLITYSIWSLGISLFMGDVNVAEAAGNPYFKIDNDSINSSRMNVDTLFVSAYLQAWRSNVFKDTELNYLNKKGKEMEGSFKVSLYFKKEKPNSTGLPARWLLSRADPEEITIINPRDRKEQWTFSSKQISIGATVTNKSDPLVPKSEPLYGYFYNKFPYNDDESSRIIEKKDLIGKADNNNPYIAVLSGRYPDFQANGVYPFNNYEFYDDLIKNDPPEDYEIDVNEPFDKALTCTNPPPEPTRSFANKDEAASYILEHFHKEIKKEKLIFDHIIDTVELFDNSPNTCPPYAMFNKSLKFFLRAAVEVGGTASSENVLFWFQSEEYSNLWLILDEDADGEIVLARSYGSDRGEQITGYLGSLIGSAVKLGPNNSMDKIITSRVFNVACLDDERVPNCTNANKITIITAVNCYFHKVATVKCVTAQDVYKASVNSSRSGTLASYYNKQAVYEDGRQMNHNAWLDVWEAKYLDTVSPSSEGCGVGWLNIFTEGIGVTFSKIIKCLVYDIFIPMIEWAATKTQEAAGISMSVPDHPNNRHYYPVGFA